MKVTVHYVNSVGKRLKNKDLVYHAVAVLVHRNLWYFSVDFKVRAEINHYASGGNEFQEEIWFETAKDRNHGALMTGYTVVTIDSSAEKCRVDFYAHMNKTNYNGLIVKDGMVGRAWDRFNHRTGRRR